jgi:hypothetical protein
MQPNSASASEARSPEMGGLFDESVIKASGGRRTVSGTIQVMKD